MIKQTINFVVYYLFEQFVFHFYPSPVLVIRYPLPVTDMVMREGGTRCVVCVPAIITSWRAAKISWQIDATDCYISCASCYRCRRTGVEQLIKRKFKTMFNCHVHHSRDQLNEGGHDHRSNSFYHFLVPVSCAKTTTKKKWKRERDQKSVLRLSTTPSETVRCVFGRVFHRLFIILSGGFFGWAKSPFSTYFPFCCRFPCMDKSPQKECTTISATTSWCADGDEYEIV